MRPGFARLDESQLRKLRELEREWDVVLVAYRKVEQGRRVGGKA